MDAVAMTVAVPEIVSTAEAEVSVSNEPPFDPKLKPVPEVWDSDENSSSPAPEGDTTSLRLPAALVFSALHRHVVFSFVYAMTLHAGLIANSVPSQIEHCGSFTIDGHV
jgi:hypothetical protein